MSRIILQALAAFLSLTLAAPAPAAERVVAVVEAAATADTLTGVIADADAPGESLASGASDGPDLAPLPAATGSPGQPGAERIAAAAPFRTLSSSSVPFLARAPPGR